MLLLDFIRYNQNLTGTKIGCREGDCGACTVLIGELKDNELRYRTATSCLTALGNIYNKHVVTVEGLNMDALNPIQQSMCDEAGTQCGFCTPGFIVSMAGFCLNEKEPSYENAVASVDGNICRCTGYKSIERALIQLTKLVAKREQESPVEFVTSQAILPHYFTSIKERLEVLITSENVTQPKTERFLGGGTDLYVQQHEEMVYAGIDFLAGKPELKGIEQNGNICTIGAASTVTEILESPIIQRYLPAMPSFMKLVSSTPIRNIATIGGNFVNASPIGDLSVLFLALDAMLVLRKGTLKREMPLKQFYKGYKQLDKSADEYLEKVCYCLPKENTLFNFEKVSKRTHLDIASVNTAICLEMDGNFIVNAHLSAGGVSPVPAYLFKTSSFLKGRQVDEALVQETVQIAQTEVSPISDARGTEEYKRLLLSQLIKAHFIKLFPTLKPEKVLSISQ